MLPPFLVPKARPRRWGLGPRSRQESLHLGVIQPGRAAHPGVPEEVGDMEGRQGCEGSPRGAAVMVRAQAHWLWREVAPPRRDGPWPPHRAPRQRPRRHDQPRGVWYAGVRLGTVLQRRPQEGLGWRVVDTLAVLDPAT